MHSAFHHSMGVHTKHFYVLTWQGVRNLEASLQTVQAGVQERHEEMSQLQGWTQMVSKMTKIFTGEQPELAPSVPMHLLPTVQYGQDRVLPIFLTRESCHKVHECHVLLLIHSDEHKSSCTVVHVPKCGHDVC